ncbi:MAG: hypothetical protein JHC93_07160 [Parachlamydiales bacterium]|nr:hypothetical protein [Parachlamydiales bacterium]
MGISVDKIFPVQYQSYLDKIKNPNLLNDIQQKINKELNANQSLQQRHIKATDETPVSIDFIGNGETTQVYVRFNRNKIVPNIGEGCLKCAEAAFDKNGEKKVAKRAYLPNVKVYNSQIDPVSLKTNTVYKKIKREMKLEKFLSGSNIDYIVYEGKDNKTGKPSAVKIAYYATPYKNNLSDFYKDFKAHYQNQISNFSPYSYHQDCKKIAINALSDLEKLSNFGYIHGDIKPDNLIGDGHLTDFDLSHKKGASFSKGCLNLKGAYAYRPPHLILEEKLGDIELEEQGPRDLFALGVCLYQLYFNDDFYKSIELEDLIALRVEARELLKYPNIFNSQFSAPRNWPTPPFDAITLLKGLLAPDYKDRLNYEQALELAKKL